MNPSKDLLEDPFIFQDMQKAVDRIREAVKREEKILIYGDYDVDGITGSAITYLALKKMGANVDVHVPHRIEEGYGLNIDSLDKLLKKKYSLVITVDNGITATDQIKFIRDKKVDVIIVDHHLPKTNFPEATAIIAASYGNKGDEGLAACGLAFKLAWALFGKFEEVEEYLDLVTIGTIADIANVLGENRMILKLGLPCVLSTKRVGLRALMESAKLSPYRLTYRDVAFMIAPRINASGRMGSPMNAFRLLVTESELEASNLAQILEDGNKDRQKSELRAYEEAVELVESDFYDKKERVLVVDSPNWHEGVIGIVASRLVERYKKPSIVVSFRNGEGKGSGRSIPHFSLFDLVTKCEDQLEKFGGHAAACGLSIKKEKIHTFRKRLNELADREENLTKEMPLDIDAEVSLSEMDMKFLKELDSLSPFGPGNKKPLFLTRDLKVKGEVKKRGVDTMQCWMSDSSGKAACEVIGFRSYEKWTKEKRADTIHLVHQPALKDFNGITSIQLELEDWSSA